MLESVVRPIAEWVTSQIIGLGYPAVILMMAIESACIPLPSEIIMPFSGFLVSRGDFNLHLAAASGAVGNLIGSIAAYAAGAYGGRGFIERYGRYVLISPHELARADRWFGRYGDWTVLVARMLPIVRTFISLPAGVSRMPFGRFVVFTFVGALPWCYLLTYIGKVLGDHWEDIRYYFHGVDYAVAAVLVVMFAVWLYRHIRSARRGAASEDA
jgi:membrane protein DedA with SNARE-associated domain